MAGEKYKTPELLNLFAFVRRQDPPLEIPGVMRSLADLLGAETSKHPVSSTSRTTDTSFPETARSGLSGLSPPPCLFNLYAEYIMRNAGLEEAQAGIKISGRNVNNLRYEDDTTLRAESEEELKAS